MAQGKAAMDDQAFLIAGAGIAGLTAALALSRRGFSVHVFEQAPRLQEAGAGLQLPPNATRILARLGVLDRILPMAMRPEAVLLKKASTLETMARVPLGSAAQARWGAPYLVLHRADLQSALLESVEKDANIALTLGARVKNAAFVRERVRVDIEQAGTILQVDTHFLIAADGVWSRLRSITGKHAKSHFSGHIAWRKTIRRDEAGALSSAIPADAVSAFMHPQFHLVAYPLDGGDTINLVVVTKGTAMPQGWSGRTDLRALETALNKAHPALRHVGSEAGWVAWPIHETNPKARWTRVAGDGRSGAVLIGDAAHAMTPFAAQGAAMGIEDAALLAGMMVQCTSLAQTLETYEPLRKPRLARVMRRGAFNKFAWHASGPVALARDAVLKWRNEASLMADFDWLYGYDVEAEL